jgi:hypothetical protein
MVDGGGNSVEISIRPGVGMLSVFAHVNYKPWFALGEFVDNAIQSFIQNRQLLRELGGGRFKLVVDISLTAEDGGRLVVRDNAAGIDAHDWSRAFIAAEPPLDRTGLSQFGMGMKSAGCWFAKRFVVRSVAVGDGLKRTLDFDVEKITRDKIETLTATIAQASRAEHGTEIVLTDLHKAPVGQTVGKMKDHLESIYRVFLRSGEVEIYFNRQALRYEQPEVLEAPYVLTENAPPVRWRKDIEFEIDAGRRVKGFAALRRVGNTARAGFALFRNNRLVQGSDDEGYRPAVIFGSSNSFRYQRLFGELHLTGFDVSYTKDGFIWGDSEGALLEVLRRQLDEVPLPLLYQAEHYRSRQAAPARRGAESAVESTANAIERGANVIGAQTEAVPDDRELPVEPADVPTGIVRVAEFQVGGVTWRVRLELTSEFPGGDWLEVYSEPPERGATRQVSVRVPMNHKFMAQFSGLSASQIEPLLRVAVGLALAEVAARAGGAPNAGTIRRNLNDLLRDALALPPNYVDEVG